MKTYLKIFSVLIGLLLLVGCAPLPITNYTPPTANVSTPRVDGSASIGNFTYIPHTQGQVNSNQVQNTAIGSIMLGKDISDLVQNATMIELQRSGILLNNPNRIIKGKIEKLKLDDLGWSVDYEYSITYQIVGQNGNILFSKTYTAKPVRDSKFSLDLIKIIDHINAQIYDCFEQFITDPVVRTLLTNKK